ncbi:MAG: hypothetical protein DRO11_02740, partial [Methanobacteriota archaeon]
RGNTDRGKTIKKRGKGRRRLEATLFQCYEPKLCFKRLEHSRHQKQKGYPRYKKSTTLGHTWKPQK